MRLTAPHLALRMSARLNDMFIPAAAIEGLLSKYCTNLAICTNLAEYPVYMPGSASLLRYRGHSFLVCTRHQLNGASMENVAIMLPAGHETTCVTSSGVRWFEGIYEGEQHEIALFNFTPQYDEIAELRPLFFDFRGQPPSVPSQKVIALITFGFPTELQSYEPEGNQLGVRKAAITCRFEGQPSDDSMLMLQPTKPLEISPDGLSGGPAFCVLDHIDGPRIYFAGVIARAGNDRIWIIKAGAIEGMIRHLIGE